jgi:hypothetical protein
MIREIHAGDVDNLRGSRNRPRQVCDVFRGCFYSECSFFELNGFYRKDGRCLALPLGHDR